MLSRVKSLRQLWLVKLLGFMHLLIISVLLLRRINMYLKNLNHRMTLRLDDDLLAFVNSASEIYSISPSDFIRQCISSVKYGYDVARLHLNDKTKKGDSGNGIDRKESQYDQL